MTRHLPGIICWVLALTLCSCATMFNSKRTPVIIVTSRPTKMIIQQDTFQHPQKERYIEAERDKKPLKIVVFNDSSSRTIQVKARNSFAYWLNLYPNWHFWTGFYIDTKTKKRYTYPKTVYIDLDDTVHQYLRFIPPDPALQRRSNVLKLTPLKLFGTDNPGMELSYERRTGRLASTQVMASYLLPVSLWELGHRFLPPAKGFRVSLEERLYTKGSAIQGTYLAFELCYLRKQYYDVWGFGNRQSYSDTSIARFYYSDTFGIKKQTVSFNLKVGYQIIHKRLSVDIFAGFGPRYREVSHFDRINPDDVMDPPRHPNVWYISNRNGRFWSVSIPVNIKIGYTF